MSYLLRERERQTVCTYYRHLSVLSLFMFPHIHVLDNNFNNTKFLHSVLNLCNPLFNKRTSESLLTLIYHVYDGI